MLSVLLVCRDGTLARLNMVVGTSRLGQITHPCESRRATGKTQHRRKHFMCQIFLQHPTKENVS